MVACRSAARDGRIGASASTRYLELQPDRSLHHQALVSSDTLVLGRSHSGDRSAENRSPWTNSGVKSRCPAPEIARRKDVVPRSSGVMAAGLYIDGVITPCA